MKNRKAPALSFEVGQKVVYPAHGVGTVDAVEEQEIAGFKLELVVLRFEREKMVLRVPMAKVASSGLRPASDRKEAEATLGLLSGRAKKSKAIWARRAQDYETKINSGAIASLAEVVRDLYRPDGVEPASFSERSILENAMARLCGELAVSLDVTETEAEIRVVSALGKRKTPAFEDAEAVAA